MKCIEARECIIDYVLGELRPEVEIQVNEHLAICEACRDELRRMEVAVDSLRNTERFKPAPYVYEKIAGSLTVTPQRRVRLFGMPRDLVFAFGAFLLGVVLTRSIDAVVTGGRQPVRIEVRHEEPRRSPFSDTVEFYAVPARNLART